MHMHMLYILSLFCPTVSKQKNASKESTFCICCWQVNSGFLLISLDVIVPVKCEVQKTAAMALLGAAQQCTKDAK